MKKRQVFVFAATFATLFATLFIFAAGTDLNNDGTTNRTDISLLATKYRTNNTTFDRNNDGIVNLFDLVAVAKNVSLNQSNGSNGSLPDDMIMASDWSTATGITNAALRDTNNSVPWTTSPGTPDTMRVVNCVSEGVGGVPFTNCLRFGCVSQSEQVGISGLPAVGVGEKRFYRYYFMGALTDSSGETSTHAIHDGTIGNNEEFDHSHEQEWSTDGTWQPTFLTGSVNGNNNIWTMYESEGSNNLVSLDKDVWYIFEVQVHRIGTTTWNLHMRISDVNGNILYDDTDFTNQWFGDGQTTLAENPTLTFFSPSGAAGLENWQFGLNGISDPTDDSPLYYIGGFAICTDDWCGNYSSLESGF